MLVELGADVNAADKQGSTPLHSAAQAHHPDALRRLLAVGASAHAPGPRRSTPLEITLATASNIDLSNTAEIVEMLLAAGAELTAACRASVLRSGANFEFYRSGFASDRLDDTDAALQKLYSLTGVTPVAARRKHDGVSPISVQATEWKQQHAELWEYN